MNARNDKGLAQKRQTISVSSPSGNEKQYAAAETQPPSPMSNDSIPAELSTFSINSHVAGSSSTIARFSMVGFGLR